MSPARRSTDDATTKDRPWLPTGLAAHGLTAATVPRLSYIVIEEIVGGDVGLSISPWPVADAKGRLRFRQLDQRREVATTLQEVRRVYRALRREREPRVGDVFAAELDWEAAGDVDAQDLVAAVAELVKGPIYDLSAEARTVAKLAAYAALTAVLSDDQVKAWNLDDTVEESDEPAPVTELTEERHGGR